MPLPHEHKAGSRPSVPDTVTLRGPKAIVYTALFFTLLALALYFAFAVPPAQNVAPAPFLTGN